MYMQDQPMNALNYREEIHFGWLRGRGRAGGLGDLVVRQNYRYLVWKTLPSSKICQLTARSQIQRRNLGYTKIRAVDNPSGILLAAISAGSNETEKLRNQICINRERGNEKEGNCLWENTWPRRTKQMNKNTQDHMSSLLDPAVDVESGSGKDQLPCLGRGTKWRRPRRR